jgi:hypothetical protein
MAAVRAQEAKKKSQKLLERNAKIDRIARLENTLNDPEATPCPGPKRKLRHTNTVREIPVDGASKGSEEGSQPTDQDFEPPSGESDDDTATELGHDIELDTPPKKKKKANKESMRAAIIAARSVGGTAKEGELIAGSDEAGPHGGCAAQAIINNGAINLSG